MAVAAVQCEFAGMMPMAERDGLGGRMKTHARVEVRSCKAHDSGDKPGCYRQPSDAKKP
jgi:hypothetical protein